MENYEQKYKEALEWVRSIYPTMQGADKEDVEHYFPELRESEDERIRKGLIKGLSAMRDIHKHQTFSDDAINIDDAIAWLEKQGEQKFWSEEDELMIQDAIHWINEFQKSNRCKDENDMQNSVTCENWLKSLKDRIQPQQKQEWSEKDEKMLSDIDDCITNLPIFYETIQVNGEERTTQQFVCSVKNWLKSIKPNHWKPTDEQMESLKIARDYYMTGKIKLIGKDLDKIYQQLKKL